MNAKKSLLFYVPFSNYGGSNFFRGALNKYIPSFSALNIEYKLHYVGPSEYIDIFKYYNFSLHYLHEYHEHLPGHNFDYQSMLYINDPTTRKLADNIIKELIDFEPNIIFAIETPTDFLRKLFPNTPVVDIMPASISRAPFEERIILEPVGLFQHSGLSHLTRNNDLLHLISEEDNFENFVKNHKTQTSYSLRALRALSPFNFSIEQLCNGKNKPWLLPLQNPDHYVYRCEFSNLSLSELLKPLLHTIPDDQTVILTQYHSREISQPESEGTISELQLEYPNIIRLPFQELSHSASQYIWPLCSGVLNLSSGVGLQAYLHGVPVNFHPRSHLFSLNALQLSPRNSGSTQAYYYSSIKFLMEIQTQDQSIFNNPELLTNILGQFEERTNSINLLERYPSIEPFGSKNYFISENKFTSARRQLEQNIPFLKSDCCWEFWKLLEKHKPKVVSFDVFDTLLERCIPGPRDVFILMETNLSSSDNRYHGFANARIEAEIQARDELQISKKQSKKEISLDDIYRYLAQNYQWERNETDRVLAIELEYEKRIIHRRSAGYALYEMACEAECTIIYISDMYLDKGHILQMLEDAGYNTKFDFWLSKDYQKCKSDGALFDLILDKMKISGPNLLHVGDNLNGDIAQPNARSIITYYLPSSASNIRSLSPTLLKLLLINKDGPTLPRCAAGLIQNKLFSYPVRSDDWAEKSFFNNNPQYFGYAAIGPYLTGFCLWLHDLWQTKYPHHTLTFLSRDGRVIKDVMECLFPDSANQCVYIKASRNSAKLSQLENLEDIKKLCDQKIFNFTIKDILIQILNLDESEIISSDHLNTRITDQYSRNLLYEELEKHSVCILQKATTHKLLYKKYIEAKTGNNPLLIVDIGYVGTIQMSIQSLIDTDVAGAYFVTFPELNQEVTQHNDKHAWIASSVQKGTLKSIVTTYNYIFESVMCSSEDSFLRMQNVNGQISPINRMNKLDSTRKKLSSEIHSGAIQFAGDIANIKFKDKYSGFQDWRNLECIMQSLFQDPLKADAKLFEGVVFEDAYGGAGTRYLIPPKQFTKVTNVSEVVWLEGFDAVKSSSRKNRFFVVVNKRLSKFLYRIEKLILRKLLPDRLYTKLTYNRFAFFADSKNKIMQYYGNILDYLE